MWDELVKSTFTLRAIIFVTINDYTGQFSLTGQMKGLLGCSECLIFTAGQFLEGSRKVVNMHHRRFLVEEHRYRSKRMVKYFIGTTVELGHAPKRQDGHYVYNMVKSVKVAYGKKTGWEDQ
jgi:hypothetical protein